MSGQVHTRIQREIEAFVNPAILARNADRLTRTTDAGLPRITDTARSAAPIASAQGAAALGNAAIQTQANPRASRAFPFDGRVSTAKQGVTIIHGALEPIVTPIGGDSRVLASRQQIADIEGAGIVIIAIHRGSEA
jgi:hypothetical protein